MSLNELVVSLDDLSEEGLDLLLRLGLGTDVRQIDDWRAIGPLIEKHQVSVSPISAEPPQWNATVDEPEYISEFGENVRIAVSKALIHALFPSAPSMKLKQRSLGELLSQDFKESWVGYTRQQSTELWSAAEAPAGTPAGEADVLLSIIAWDAV